MKNPWVNIHKSFSGVMNDKTAWLQWGRSCFCSETFKTYMGKGKQIGISLSLLGLFGFQTADGHGLNRNSKDWLKFVTVNKKLCKHCK